MHDHYHHRQRMKQKLMTVGTEAFHKHELVEMLLFYSKPQGDTNPCAHALMEHFGGVKGMFEASIDELKQVDGVGEHTACLIKLLPELYRVYEREMHEKTKTYNTISKIIQFLHPYFVGCNVERTYLLMLNNRMNLIDCALISQGTVNRCEILLRLIGEKVHAKKAAYVVLAHNHPNGSAQPSRSDISTTRTVYHHLEEIKVPLLEHLIFTETEFYPILKKSLDIISPFFDPSQPQTEMSDYFYNVDENRFRFPKLFDDDDE